MERLKSNQILTFTAHLQPHVYLYVLMVRLIRTARSNLFCLRGAIVLITQNFDPSSNWMDKMQLSEIFTAKRCGS